MSNHVTFDWTLFDCVLHFQFDTGYVPQFNGSWCQLSVIADENTDQRQLGIAVLAETLIKANTKVASCMEYVLVWDMPIVQFGGGERKYRR